MRKGLSSILMLICIKALCGNLYIKNVSVIPNSPTIYDTIKIAYSCESPAYPSFIYNHDLGIDSNRIQLKTCHRWGMTDGVQMIYDTVTIGKLDAGMYQFNLFCFVTQVYLDSFCLTPLFSNAKDSAVLSFSVSSFNSDIKLPKNYQLSISPNPATTQLTLTIPPPTQPTTATITDINGRLLRKEQLLSATNTLDVAELPAGLYFVTVQSAEQRWVRRFVKQ